MTKLNASAAALAALGVGLAALGDFQPAGGAGLIALGLAFIMAALAVALRPRWEERPPRTHAHRWRVEIAVPMSPQFAATLKTQLEDEVLGLRLELDWEHDEVLVSFLVDASGADLAERIGQRRVERHGLVVDAVRALRATTAAAA